MQADDFEQVVYCRDRSTGLRSIIAIHDTTLGPALGGVRMRPYATEHEALEDVLRLARGMTYKSAMAGLNLGGGKSVIIGDPYKDKSEALLRAHGRFVETLGGRYIPGIDVGTSQADLRVIGVEARQVSSVGEDPSPFTALGVHAAMRACVEEELGTTDFSGVRVAIQGVGHVGEALARMLASGGAELILSDQISERARMLSDEFGATTVPADEIISSECEVFAPCATGAVINDETIPKLRCRVIAGAANNVLAEPRHGAALRDRGILYAPDYVANAGGLILLEEERAGHTYEQSQERVREIYDVTVRIIERARRDGIPTAEASDRLAEERLAMMRSVGPPYVPDGVLLYPSGRAAPSTSAS
jgi:leucine dehydrogenase